VDSLAAVARENTSQQRDRDLRLDVCRGIALWFIFLDHVPGNIGSWFTLSHYGFSDTTELFMFVSGVTCALAYGEVHRHDGWFAVFSHTLRRSWQIYVAFLTLTICLRGNGLSRGRRAACRRNQYADCVGVAGAALAHALTLKFRPVNTDVLPTFVLFHLSFAPLLWLLVKSPNLTLGAALLLYLLVQTFGWNLPQWPRNEWYFNPLAWQFLVVLGAWWVAIGRKSWQSLLISPVVTAFAALYLLFAFLVALSWSIKPLADMMPQILAKLIYPIDKSDLDPLRLLHFLAIALLVARLVGPDWRGLTTPVLRSAVRCGENSLEIYCVGVLLSLAAHVVLVKVSDGLVMQIALSLAGVAAMIAIATLLTRIKIASRGEPRLF